MYATKKAVRCSDFLAARLLEKKGAHFCYLSFPAASLSLYLSINSLGGMVMTLLFLHYTVYTVCITALPPIS